MCTERKEPSVRKRFGEEMDLNPDVAEYPALFVSKCSVQERKSAVWGSSQ